MALLDRLQVSRVRGTGAAARRVLLVGDHRFLGSDDDAGADQPGLVGCITERALPHVDVDAVSDLAPALRAMEGAGAAWRLWRYDLVVLVLDAADRRHRSVRLQRVLADLVDRLDESTRLLVVLPEPQEPGRGRRADRGLRDLLETPRVHALPTPLHASGGLAAPDAVADALLEGLDLAAAPGTGAHDRRAEPQDEPGRQRAVDRSLADIGAVSLDLQRVVMLASGSFGVPFAQVNLVDRGRLRSLAYVGRTSDALRGTLSQLVVQQERALMVEDTQADPRFTAIEETAGPGAIRFYAGHPIESVDGYRIGTLCVFDTVPHPVLDGDEEMLRDLALLAEGEILELTRRRPAGPWSGPGAGSA